MEHLGQFRTTTCTTDARTSARQHVSTVVPLRRREGLKLHLPSWNHRRCFTPPSPVETVSRRPVEHALALIASIVVLLGAAVMFLFRARSHTIVHCRNGQAVSVNNGGVIDASVCDR